jgi:ABC-type nitrate/sulfonate/bicarbonate transport system substrate-binding protein
MPTITPAQGAVVAGIVLLALAIVFLNGTAPPLLYPHAPESPTVYLLYASAGSLPQLLNTGQIDAFLVWEPIVSNAELSGIGKRIAVPADLPPYGKWDNAAINELVLRRDVIARYPDVSALLSALTTAGINRTREDPALAGNITAAWVFGDTPILTPVGSLDPLDVERHSFANMNFTATAMPPDSGIVQSVLATTSGAAYDPRSMMDPAVAERGVEFLEGSRQYTPAGEIPLLGIGYIPSTDNYAPLYVMVKDSAYFCDRYGFCLVPDDPDQDRPVACTLFVNNTPAARINLVPGQSGGGIMTTIGQGALDGAFVGSVPAELQIGLGNPAVLVESVNTGGSGLVVAPDAPCSDWTGFVRWATARSAAGSPVVIATVQSSIQEDMVREACAYENITVKFYGSDITTDTA